MEDTSFMSATEKGKYSADAHIAEFYDQTETQTEDVGLIRRLIAGDGPLVVFEPFCGTGRIAIPLARIGHRLIALDESEVMLARLRAKLESEPQAVRKRFQTVLSPVFAADWPAEVDLVLFGGNCFYEVSSSDEQRALVWRAASSLCPGGHVYIDVDDHQSVELSPAWRKPPDQVRRAFPSGTCEDGTVLEGSTQTVWYDVHARIVNYVRRLTVTHPDGGTTHHEWRETCHPVVMGEILAWVREAGLTVEATFGDQRGGPYGPESRRAVVWARKD